jgi:hypothetical protein
MLCILVSMRKTLPYDWVWHLLVKVAPLLNDSFMCGGMENADRSKEVWPRTILFQDLHDPTRLKQKRRRAAASRDCAVSVCTLQA